jgi:hypothetical protein
VKSSSRAHRRSRRTAPITSVVSQLNLLETRTIQRPFGASVLRFIWCEPPVSLRGQCPVDAGDISCRSCSRKEDGSRFLAHFKRIHRGHTPLTAIAGSDPSVLDRSRLLTRSATSSPFNEGIAISTVMTSGCSPCRAPGRSRRRLPPRRSLIDQRPSGVLHPANTGRLASGRLPLFTVRPQHVASVCPRLTRFRRQRHCVLLAPCRL